MRRLAGATLAVAVGILAGCTTITEDMPARPVEIVAPTPILDPAPNPAPTTTPPPRPTPTPRPDPPFPRAPLICDIRGG